MVNNLHQIKDIGLKTREYLEKGDVDMLGELLHVHWETRRSARKRCPTRLSTSVMMWPVKRALWEEKLMGAGGGGFLMFYCQNGEKYAVTQAMHKIGLRRERFKIDWDGARVMLNSKESSHST